MSYLVVVVLSVLWLGFFFPSLLQARRSSSPLNSATSFQESLTRISTGRVVTAADAANARRAPRRTRRQIARQRDVLAALTAAFIAALALAIAFGGFVWLLLLPAGAGLAAYVVALRLQALHRRPRRRSAAPRTAVRPPAADDAVVPSVGRRAVQPEEVAQREELERIAG